MAFNHVEYYLTLNNCAGAQERTEKTIDDKDIVAKIHDEPKKGKKSDNVPDQTPEEFYKMRKDMIARDYKNFYHQNFEEDIDIPTFIREYSYLQNDQTFIEKVHQIVGDVQFIRSSGEKIYFIPIYSKSATIQVLANYQFYQGDFVADMTRLNRGDVIHVRGYPARSKRGELSITPIELKLVAPCYWPVPKLELKDPETRFSNRTLDFKVNRSHLNPFVIRSRVYSIIRRYLLDREFIEVETPILSSNLGGANATPFTAELKSLKMPVFMRVAPELYLKRFVVAGLHRVFEIGKQFRNEDIDRTHYPEFTSLELYQALSDYRKLMVLTEDLLQTIVRNIHGCLHLEFDSNSVSFHAPFKRIDIVPALEEFFGVQIPFDSDGLLDFLLEQCQRFEIECSPPITITRLFDKLIGHLIEPQCINPTFLVGHPSIMSPLAKTHEENPHVSQRFELFICKKEYANAYSEQNDPDIQRRAFAEQLKEREQGDDEVPLPDEEFIRALEYGLPPTGGLGIGIDRLIMLLTNNVSIKEVLGFPIHK